MSSAQQQVVSHLQGLAQQALALLQDLPARRQLIEQYFNIGPETQHYSATITPVQLGDMAAEWVQAAGADANQRLLYIHGGSWVSGSPQLYRPLLSKLSELTGLSILAIDYRLAPEHPFPAGLDDSYEAYLWLRENGPQGAAPSSNVFMMGDSAGGNLVLACLHKLNDNQEKLPNAAVALSPATDFTGQSPSMKTKAGIDPIVNPIALTMLDPIYLRGAVALDHPYASPLFGDLSQLPPLLIQVGEMEVLLDDSVRFAEQAKQQGSDVTLQQWPDMPHVFQGFAPVLPQASDAIEKIAAFIKQHLD
ncbi:MAG: alpha/beta hydrolase [Halopseudomonas sp.]